MTTEKDMFRLIRRRFGSSTKAGLPNAIIAPSVPIYHGSGVSIADAVVIESHRNNDMRRLFPGQLDAQFPIHAFEIKTQRSDWLRELKTGGVKSKPWRSHAHFFWLVIPDISVVGSAHDIPEGWGLLVGSQRLRVARKPTANRPEPLSFETQMMIARCAVKDALLEGTASRQSLETAHKLSTTKE